MKKIISMITILTMVLSLFACNGKITVKSDIAPSEIVDGGLSVQTSSHSSMVDIDEDYFDNYFDIDKSLIDSYSIKVAEESTNLDSIGIIKAKNIADVEKVKAVVDSYIQTLKEDKLMQGYMPTEFKKREVAEVKISGQYVLFMILSDDAKVAVSKVFEDKLTK